MQLNARFIPYGFALASLVCGLALAGDGPADLVIADFEKATYSPWKTEGTAFGDKPAQGTLPGQMAVTGFLGKGLVNSFVGGDDATGTLTSPPFTIERNHINFLIGGGDHPGKTAINLLVEGKVVRTETGPNAQSGGTEALEWASWDVKDLQGKAATIQIVDQQKGGWGHINIDQIVQSNQRAAVAWTGKHRHVRINGRYLLFPISNAVKPCRMKLWIDGQLRHDFDINLAVDQVDWWAFLEFPADQGKSATITVDKVPVASKGFELIESSDSLRNTQPLYDEPLRPQLRFSQKRGWNNDPNGMVYFAGEYHFFWQSNPFGPNWANMYWGHAVSKDLVHWDELPYALYPRVMAKEHCFSGSANIDINNTGGWQTGAEKVMVAPFTDTGAGEAIAISQDRGRSWTYLPTNPIIPKHDGRDPKLVWYEPGKHWVIAVYSRARDQDVVAIYNSKDLKKWERVSEIPGFFECPELFELPVDGDANNRRWVLMAADAKYVVGSFDGKTFKPEHPGKHQLHYGEYYASQCFSLVPGGRVIQVGWARINMPGMPFNQAFSLPTELSLTRTADGIRLRAQPVAELNTLRDQPTKSEPGPLRSGTPTQLAVATQLLDINLTVHPGSARSIKLVFGSNTLSYDVATHKLNGIPLALEEGALRLRVVVDRPMFEVVGGAGQVYATLPRKDGGQAIKAVELVAEGGDARLDSFEVFPMRSIWKR